jgi:hypothetical protein
MKTKLSAVCAATLIATSAFAQNREQPGPDGERTIQQQGESSVLKGDTTGLGPKGNEKTEDIRRTSTGDLHFSSEQLQQIRDAVKQAKLERSGQVAFSVSVGASVPRQAGARDLPSEVAKAVSSQSPLRYVLLGDQLVLIDRDTDRIVAIIPGMG